MAYINDTAEETSLEVDEMIEDLLRRLADAGIYAFRAPIGTLDMEKQTPLSTLTIQ